MIDNVDLKSIFDSSTCVRRGLSQVTNARSKDNPLESHSLYYEQHGTGLTKIVFIMGLNSSSFSWSKQIAHFGRLPEYSALVFDNRGVGHSTTPRGPYTTSVMAEDIIVLLELLGWTGKRDLHVVGISLGGMIAQELATRIPERIASLSLCATTAGGYPWSNLPPVGDFELELGVTLAKYKISGLMTIADPMMKIRIILPTVFPVAWLDGQAENDSAGRTNRAVQTEAYSRRIEVTPPQTFLGSISQMAAGLTHHVSASRLRSISVSIPKVLIVTGDQDNLVDARNSHYIKEHMPEAEFVQWENTGHALHLQRPVSYNALLARVFKEGMARVEREKSTTTNI